MFDGNIRQKMIDYYTHYYRDDCALSDWRLRVEQRLREEEIETDRMVDFQKKINIDFNRQKHCIVGAGTGGLAIALKEKYDCDVYGVEPSEQEFEIIQEKCEKFCIDKNNFKKEYGEKMSFPDEMFDVVHCYTVLEHVQDVDRCIKEMIRIIKPEGRILISTPNYAFPYEAHYKIIFPTFLPKLIGRLYLRILGKSSNFLNTINYITERKLNRLLHKKNITWFRIFHSQKPSQGKMSGFFNFCKFFLNIYPNQEVVIMKNHCNYKKDLI